VQQWEKDILTKKVYTNHQLEERGLKVQKDYDDDPEAKYSAVLNSERRNIQFKDGPRKKV